MSLSSGPATEAGIRIGPGFPRVATLVENARAQDWWEFKIPPLLATAYATAFLLQISFADLWPWLLLILGALLPGAVYVCVLNDITDLEDDLECGKANRMAGRSRGFKFFALTACLLMGLAAGWFLRNYPVTLLLYAANWAAYTLYSSPPFRLKARGIWGVVMDASGAHLLPTLWIASLLAEATGHALPRLFLYALGTWAWAAGVRGILWHQLLDRENDRRGRAATFAAQKNPASIRRGIAGAAFPLELAALGFLLFQVHTPWAWFFLGAYGVEAWLIQRWLGIDVVLTQPTSCYTIMLAAYYQLHFPLTFLFALTQQSLAFGWLIALQLALFPHCFHVSIGQLQILIRYRLLVAVRIKVQALLPAIRRSVSRALKT